MFGENWPIHANTQKRFQSIIWLIRCFFLSFPNMLVWTPRGCILYNIMNNHSLNRVTIYTMYYRNFVFHFLLFLAGDLSLVLYCCFFFVLECLSKTKTSKRNVAVTEDCHGWRSGGGSGLNREMRQHTTPAIWMNCSIFTQTIYAWYIFQYGYRSMFVVNEQVAHYEGFVAIAYYINSTYAHM